MVMVNLRTWSGDRQVCQTCGEDADINAYLPCRCRPRFVEEWHTIRVYVGFEQLVWYGPSAWKGGEHAVFDQRSFRL